MKTGPSDVSTNMVGRSMSYSSFLYKPSHHQPLPPLLVYFTQKLPQLNLYGSLLTVLVHLNTKITGPFSRLDFTSKPSVIVFLPSSSTLSLTLMDLSRTSLLPSLVFVTLLCIFPSWKFSDSS